MGVQSLEEKAQSRAQRRKRPRRGVVNAFVGFASPEDPTRSRARRRSAREIPRDRDVLSPAAAKRSRSKRRSNPRFNADSLATLARRLTSRLARRSRSRKAEEVPAPVERSKSETAGALGSWASNRSRRRLKAVRSVEGARGAA